MNLAEFTGFGLVVGALVGLLAGLLMKRRT
jgi:hypothetical protein